MVAAERVYSGEVTTPRLWMVPTTQALVELEEPAAHIALADRPSPQRVTKEHLRSIEGNIGRHIKTPNRPLSADEGALIAFARAALEVGEATQAWDWIDLPVSLDQARTMVDEFAGGVVRSLWLSSDDGERFVLFGIPLPLGPTQLLLPQARLINEQAVRRELARRERDDDSLLLRFGPDRLAVAIFRYPDWLPGGRWRGAAHPPLLKGNESRQSIAREFPGRWLIRLSTSPTALTDLLSDPVRVALDQLDRAERDHVLRLLPVLWQWRGERSSDRIMERTPIADDLILMTLADNLGLIVQRGDGDTLNILEIVRPRSLQGTGRDRQ